ncbi:MAG: AAA family ATPase [Lachnospiraceae bacterium]|nr:AAA family ATPase [Lachnospiraceae bacterium]
MLFYEITCVLKQDNEEQKDAAGFKNQEPLQEERPRQEEISQDELMNQILEMIHDEDREEEDWKDLIKARTESFNEKHKEKENFFIARITSKEIILGSVVRDADKLYKAVEEYLNLFDFEPERIWVNEVTLDTLISLLRVSYRNKFIMDKDEILDPFELGRLDFYRRTLYFTENIISTPDKKTVYEEAGRYLLEESFEQELDRVYAKQVKRGKYGHPVHYLMEFDDGETEDKAIELLLAALYENGRLQSRRNSEIYIYQGNPDLTTHLGLLYQTATGGTVTLGYSNINLSEDDDQASGEMELVTETCEIIQKYRNKVLTILCLPRECTHIKQLFYEQLGTMTMVEIREAQAGAERAGEYMKMLAKDAGVRTDKKLFAALEKDKTYLTPELKTIFNTWYDRKLKTTVFPQYKEVGSVNIEEIKKAPKGRSIDELEEMIGLQDAKDTIHKALNYYKIQRLYKELGVKADKPAMHMVFTGNPGTAKTTVARLFAGIMRENNLLTKGHLVEVGRGDLVGKYVGWTADIVAKKFKEASGGVLFIDEAYSLVDDRDGSYGDEAINTLVQEMENHRDDMVVILAGYPDKMEGLLKKNPGLRSRIAFHVNFADYTPTELLDITRLMGKNTGVQLTEEAFPKLESIFKEASKQDDFGNGRYVRNLLEHARMKQAGRLLQKKYEDITATEATTLTADDFEAPEVQAPEKRSFGFL